MCDLLVSITQEDAEKNHTLARWLMSTLEKMRKSLSFFSLLEWVGVDSHLLTAAIPEGLSANHPCGIEGIMHDELLNNSVKHCFVRRAAFKTFSVADYTASKQERDRLTVFGLQTMLLKVCSCCRVNVRCPSGTLQVADLFPAPSHLSREGAAWAGLHVKQPNFWLP